MNIIETVTGLVAGGVALGLIYRYMELVKYRRKAKKLQLEKEIECAKKDLRDTDLERLIDRANKRARSRRYPPKKN
jgi:hypothetical protein